MAKPGERERPDRRHLQRPVEGRAEAGADRPAGQLLGGIGQAVEDNSRHQKIVISTALAASVTGPNGAPMPRHQREGGEQHEGADHDVAVEPEQRLQPLGGSKIVAQPGARCRSKRRA